MAKRKTKRTEHAPEETEPMSKDLTQYVTTKQAAEMLGVNRFWIVRLLADKRLKGIKLGHDWLVYQPSIEKYNETKSKRGRPPSGAAPIESAN